MRSLLLALAASRGASVRGPVVRSLPSARRGVPRLSDDWMFVGMREQMADDSRELRAIVDPFGRSMLVGEEQWQRISSPELLLQLNAARQADALIARIPSISCTGAQATVVRVAELSQASVPSARLVAVSRCVVEGITHRRPQLLVRVRSLRDQAMVGADLEEAQQTTESLEMLWDSCVRTFQRLQGLQLQVSNGSLLSMVSSCQPSVSLRSHSSFPRERAQSKLRLLGSESSAAMLAIPLEQQVELSKKSSKEAERSNRQLVEAGIDESLTAGANLTLLMQEALAQQPEDDLAMIPPSAAADNDNSACLSAQLSLFSFVALRLTRGRVEDPDDFLEDQAVPTQRQAEGTNTLSRLKLCERRLQTKVAEMQAQISLLALMDPEE